MIVTLRQGEVSAIIKEYLEDLYPDGFRVYHPEAYMGDHMGHSSEPMRDGVVFEAYIQEEDKEVPVTPLFTENLEESK